MKYPGSCHCGAIKFIAEANETVNVIQCNCSICQKTGDLHLVLPKSKFKLLQGEGNITSYRFNTGVANHTFCKTCGVRPFYTPRSNPDGVSVNVRCFDVQPKEIKLTNFDGQNWEEYADGLANLSKE